MATGWANSKRLAELPGDWQTRRAKVLRRDPVCMLCHAAASTDADHVGDPTDHSLTNLQGLCHPCHVRVTIDRREAARPRRRRREERHPGDLA